MNETIRTKICDGCGKELPLKSFPRWTKKDGTIKYFHHCYKCVNNDQKARRAGLKRKDIIRELSDEDIKNEAIRRGIIKVESVYVIVE